MGEWDERFGSTWREQLAFEKAAWVYSLYSPVYTVYTLYKLLTVHPTGLNLCTFCTLLLEHSRMFQNPNHSKQPSAVSLQLSAFSFQPSAFSLQLSAFSLSAFRLQPTVWSTNQSRASRFMLCSDWSNRWRRWWRIAICWSRPLLTRGAVIKTKQKY